MEAPMLVRIRDFEHQSDYDYFVIAPPGMTAEQAAKAVDVAIREVKGANPAEYQFAELEEKLRPLGFVIPTWTDSYERW